MRIVYIVTICMMLRWMVASITLPNKCATVKKDQKEVIMFSDNQIL